MTQAAVATQLKEMRDCLDKHDEFINGNGKPGAKTRLELLEDHFGMVEKKIDRLNNSINILIIAVISGGIGWFLFTELPALHSTLK
jgi:hypothetical protein